LPAQAGEAAHLMAERLRSLGLKLGACRRISRVGGKWRRANWGLYQGKTICRTGSWLCVARSAIDRAVACVDACCNLLRAAC
jgi:hypothetical protein